MNLKKIKELQSYIYPGTVNLLILDIGSIFSGISWKTIFGQEIVSLDDLYLNYSGNMLKHNYFRKTVEREQQRVRNTQEKTIFSYLPSYLGMNPVTLSFVCSTVFECNNNMLMCKKNRWSTRNFEMILTGLKDEIVYKWNEFLKIVDNSKK